MRLVPALSVVALLVACGDKVTTNPQSSPTDPTTDWTDADTDTDSDSDTDSDTDTDTDTDLEIAGSWLDSWGTTHVIDSATWTQTYPSADTAGEDSVYTFAISQYSNDDDMLVAQNDSANEYNADLWSRFDWSWDTKGGLWYCQTAYGAKSEKEALATPAADSSDMDAGCGGFSWTALTSEQ